MDPTSAQVNDPARLSAVAATGLLDTAPEEAFDRLARLASALLEAPLAFITLVDARRSFWKSCAGPGAATLELRENTVEQSFCQYVIADGRPLIVGDVRAEPRTWSNPSIAEMGVVAWAGFPILGEGEEVLGTLCAVDTRPRQWSPQHVAVLEALAGAAGNELRLRAALVRSEDEREALAESEERFRRLADAAPVMIWTADAEGRADYHSAGWLSFRGRTADEERGDGWWEGVHPDDRERVAAAWRTAVRERSPFRAEVRFRDARGRWRTVIDSGSPRHTASGQFAGFVGSCADVTEQIEAGERDRRRAEQLSQLASAAVVINSASTLGDRLEAVTEQAAAVIGAHQAVTSFTVGRDWSQAITAVHLSDRYAAFRDYVEPPDGSGIYAVVCETNRPMRLTQAELEAHPRWRGFGAAGERHPAMEGWLAAPLVGRDGANIGLIQLSDAVGGEFTAEDEAILVQLAQLASLAVENARLHEKEQLARRTAERARARTARLQRITADLAGAQALEDVAGIIVREGMEAFDARTGIIALRRGDVIETLHAVGYTPEQAESLRRIPLDAPVPIAGAMRTRSPIWLGSREDWVAHGFAEPHIEPAATAVAPLVSQGEVVGAVAFRFAGQGRVMTPAERVFLITLAGQCAQALDRARLYQAEHELAETLQRSLLPERLAASPRMRFAVRYQSSAMPGEVGGDWYEAIELPGGRIGLSVGDVVGRGPGAAAVMGQVRSALAAIALTASGPAEALDRLGGFATHLSGAYLTTVAYAELTPETGELRYACAGHPPPLLADGRGGAEFLWDGRGAPLGARAGGYVEARRTMAPGQTLLLYTDGLFERRDRTLDARLAQLAGIAAAAGPSVTLESLADSVVAGMSEDGETKDDAALLLARLGPAPVAVAVPARPDALAPLRRTLRDWLATWGAGPAAAVDLPLALGEATANAVEHAYADGGENLVRVEFSCEAGGGFLVRVRDTGRWQAVPAPGDRGRGLPLMRAIMDAVEIDAGDGGTTITMRWTPHGGAAPATMEARPPVAGAAAGSGTLADVVLERHPGVVVARLDGEVDLSNAREVGERLRPLVAAEPRVVIDLSGVGYLDSAGLHMLAELEAGPPSARVELVAPPHGAVGGLLRLAGYEEIFAIAPGLDHALGVAPTP